jgi:hypothetical protein
LKNQENFACEARFYARRLFGLLTIEEGVSETLRKGQLALFRTLDGTRGSPLPP